MAILDDHGRPIGDPTMNVRGLLDDAAEHQREILRLHTERSDNLRDAASTLHNSDIAHMKDVANLRATHYKELREKEEARIDAIRAVDVAAVAAAAAVSATQATTLASQVALSADAMRAQVAASAQASQEGLSRVVTPLQVAIDDLRRAQYEAQGQKVQVHEAQGTKANVGMWVGVGVAALIGFVSLILGVIDVVMKLQN